MTSVPLADRHCVRLERGTPPLPEKTAESLLQQLHDGWSMTGDGKGIARSFSFADYYRTIAFVNALAWIAHTEDHHPDLEVGYDHCRVLFSTHSAGGLSENDFICAAKLDALKPDS